MFRKRDGEQLAPGSSASADETAYEDNWYRSLKALSERHDDEPTQLEDDVPVEASVEDNVPVEASVEAGVEDDVPVEADVPEVFALPEDLETRAGQLLERLRALQRRGEEAERAPEPEARSVWS